MSAPSADRVTGVIAEVTGCGVAHVRAVQALYDLPGFDSIALAEILERLEGELGAEIPAEWIVPEAFASLGALTGLLAAAAAAAGQPACRPVTPAGHPAGGRT